MRYSMRTHKLIIRPDRSGFHAEVFMNAEKNERCLAIFLRGIRGEKITVSEHANEFGVSTKSISRGISEIRCFLAENRELTGHAELNYDRSAKCFTIPEEIHLDKGSNASGQPHRKGKVPLLRSKADCSEGVVDMLWKLADDIRSRTEITITYYNSLNLALIFF